MEADEVKAYEVELYQSLEYAIACLEDYRAGRSRYLRQKDVDEITMLLRNYRRERFGNPITDQERQA